MGLTEPRLPTTVVVRDPSARRDLHTVASLQVDEIVARLKAPDAKFFGITVLATIKDYAPRAELRLLSQASCAETIATASLAGR